MVMHFVDRACASGDFLPVCGAWNGHVTWTTVPQVVTCPACRRLAPARADGTPALAPPLPLAVAPARVRSLRAAR